MVICSVIKCSNRSVRNYDVSYFSFPRVIENKGRKYYDVSVRRRKEWLARVNRSDLNNENLKHKRICSIHFINGKPSSLLDEINPDWAPSLELGHDKYKENLKQINTRYLRAAHRQESDSLGTSNTLQTSSSTDLQSNCSSTITAKPVMESGASPANLFNGVKTVTDQYTQTDCIVAYLTALEEEVANLREEKNLLKQKVKDLTISEETLTCEDKAHFYTGLPSIKMLMVVFNFIRPQVEYQPNSMTLFQSFMVFLMRLRLNLFLQDLAYRLDVSSSTITRVFNSWLDAAFISMHPTILWPERKALEQTMPSQFRVAFGTKVAVILDCFEIPIDRPTSLVTRAATWSNYKHHNTVKLLIAVAPQGVITFISKAWGGRVSDKYITENCGILEKLVPGDYILADRGFNISDAVGFYCAELIKPASMRGKIQLSPEEIQDTRKLGALRIHVERVIGNLRRKFTILRGQLSSDCLIVRNGELYAPIDKIVIVCSSFTNLSSSIVNIS